MKVWQWIKTHPQRVTSFLAGLVAFIQGYTKVVTKLLGPDGMEYVLASVAFIMFLLAQIQAKKDE